MSGPVTFVTVVAVTFLFFATCTASDSQLLENIKQVTHVLRPGIEKHVDQGYEFQMFCRIGEKKYLTYYFRTATLRITSSAEDIKLIKGHSPKDVYLQYHQSTKWLLWIANVLPWRARDTTFPTFNTSCVGISTTKPYTAMVIIRPVDPWRVLTLIGGIALFFFAPGLSESTVFFYTSGTLLGGLATVLVLLFIFSKFFPKGKFGYFFLSMIWTLAFYFAGETYKQIEELIHQKLPYLVAYLFIGFLVSFLVCYRWGPPTNPRTLDIIRWILQVSGLVLVHFSSDFIEVSTTIILLILVIHNTNIYLRYQLERFYRRMFPTTRRFLSEEEYITQGAVETQKGLEELRQFCSSPESKPWKLVTRLRNPRRFSNFMEGSSHLNDDEVLAYDYEPENQITYKPKLDLPSPAQLITTVTSQTRRPLANTTNGSINNQLPITDDDDSEAEELQLDEDSLETDDED